MQADGTRCKRVPASRSESSVSRSAALISCLDSAGRLSPCPSLLMRIDGIQRHAPIFVQTAGTCNREVPAFCSESSVTRGAGSCPALFPCEARSVHPEIQRIGSISVFASICERVCMHMRRKACQTASKRSVTRGVVLVSRPLVTRDSLSAPPFLCESTAFNVTHRFLCRQPALAIGKCPHFALKAA